MKIVIASHGKLASGYKSSIELLIGSSEKFTFIDAYCDERNLKDDIEEFFKSVCDEEQVILMSDLYGGSVNQVMYLFLNRKNTILITGINLPLVLELTAKDEDLKQEEIRELIQASRQALLQVEFDETVEENSNAGEADFF